MAGGRKVPDSVRDAALAVDKLDIMLLQLFVAFLTFVRLLLDSWRPHA